MRLVGGGEHATEIQDYRRETGQPVPNTRPNHPLHLREPFRYDQVWQHLTKYVSEQPSTLHIAGGGCQDRCSTNLPPTLSGSRLRPAQWKHWIGKHYRTNVADGVIAGLTEGRKCPQLLAGGNLEPKIRLMP